MMPPSTGLAFTDELLFTPHLDHEAVVVLAHWQDGLQRDSSSRQIAAALRMRRTTVRAIEQSLIDNGIVRVKTGSRYANGRRIVNIEERYDRRRSKNFIVVPPSLLALAVVGGKQNIALRLRYLALLCLDQQRRGLACITDAEAADILETTARSIATTRRYLLKSGAIRLHSTYEQRSIFLIEGAFVPPDAARFKPSIKAPFTRSEPIPLRDGNPYPYAMGTQSTTLTTTTTKEHVVEDSLRSSSTTASLLCDDRNKLNQSQLSEEDDPNEDQEQAGQRKVAGVEVGASLSASSNGDQSVAEDVFSNLRRRFETGELTEDEWITARDEAAKTALPF